MKGIARQSLVGSCMYVSVRDRLSEVVADRLSEVVVVSKVFHL